MQIAYCAGVDAQGGGEPGLRYAANFDGEWYTRDWATADACEGPSLWLRGDGGFTASFAASLDFSGGWVLITCGGGDEPPPPPEPGIESAEWAWSIAYPWDPEPVRARGSTSNVFYDHEPYIGAAAFHHESGELRVVVTEAGLQGPVEVVDTGCPATSSVSAAFDAGGGLHAAWVSCRQLRYARRDDGNWPVVVLADGEAGAVGNAALAIGPDETIASAFRQGGDVMLASAGAGDAEWSIEEVDRGHAAVDVALAIGPDGSEHLAWIDDALGLRHAWRTLDGWSVQTMESAASPSDASIAAGPGGAVAISYRAGTDLHVVWRPCAFP